MTAPYTDWEIEEMRERPTDLSHETVARLRLIATVDAKKARAERAEAMLDDAMKARAEKAEQERDFAHRDLAFIAVTARTGRPASP